MAVNYIEAPTTQSVLLVKRYGSEDKIFEHDKTHWGVLLDELFAWIVWFTIAHFSLCGDVLRLFENLGGELLLGLGRRQPFLASIPDKSILDSFISRRSRVRMNNFRMSRWSLAGVIRLHGPRTSIAGAGAFLAGVALAARAIARRLPARRAFA